MTIQLTTTTTAEINPEFPLYLESLIGATQYYFKSETEGIDVSVIGRTHCNIRTCTLPSTLQVHADLNQPLTPSTRFKFAQVMAAASTKFDEIISDELLETEVEYPLNAVL